MKTNPYEPSIVESETQCAEAWRDGDLVVVSASGVFPARCVFCNRESTEHIAIQVPRRQQIPVMLQLVEIVLYLTLIAILTFGFGQAVQWKIVQAYPNSGSILYLVAFGGLFGFVGPRLASLLRPPTSLQLGICTRHGILRRALLSVPILAALCVALALILLDAPRDSPFRVWKVQQYLLLCGFMGLVGAPIALILTCGSLNPRVVKTDEADRLWINGIPKAFLEGLPNWERR